MNSTPIDLHVTDETSELETVVLGIGTSPGKPRLINSKSIQTYNEGKCPKEADFVSDLHEFEQVLTDNGVTVLKPHNIPDLKQIFVRDIGFVIDDRFVVAPMRADSRRKEIEGIEFLSKMIDESKIIHPWQGFAELTSAAIKKNKFKELPVPFIEGGDVVQYGNKIFVGFGERTNQAGVDFLREAFPHKEIFAFEMKRGTCDPRKDILHLDCAFQPIGEKWALFHEEGFVLPPEPIVDIFGRENLIPISAEEMEALFPNILSLSPIKVISCSAFTRLNNVLRDKGIEVLEINYEHVSSIGGLLRCSTLPLVRK